MPATGTEAVLLSQLLTLKNSIDTDIDAKQDALPTGTSGQVLTSNGSSGVSWTTLAEATTYEGTLPIVVSGANISVNTASQGSSGVVEFATDSDFATYMGIS